MLESPTALLPEKAEEHADFAGDREKESDERGGERGSEPEDEKEKRKAAAAVTSTDSDQDVGTGPPSSRPGSARVRDGGDPGVEERVEDVREDYISGIRLWLVMLAITLAVFLMLLDLSIIVTAIPRITSDFHSLADVGWYGSAYQLAAAAVQPLSGKIYTYFRSKWAFLTFFGIFELGSLLCGVSTSSTMLIVSRAVAGLGTAGVQSGALTILAGSVPLHRRPLLTGILMGFAQIGVVMGPLIGGALTQYTTWRWCFYINLPIGAIVAVLVIVIHVPEQVAKPPFRNSLAKSVHSLDLTGFAVFAGATIQLLLALQWGGTKYAWDSATVIGLLCGAAGTLILFLLLSARKGDGALIPPSMIVVRAVWSSSLVTLFLMSVLICNSYFIPIYFQAIRGESPFTSGVDYLPSVLGQLLTAVLSGYLIGKMGYYLPWAVAGAAITCVGNGLASTLSPSTPTGKWIGYQILMGGGRGFVMQVPYIAVQNTLPPSQISTAISLLSFGQSLGGSMFLTIGNTVFGNKLRSELATDAPNVDADAVILAGATAFRSVVSPADLPGVLTAFAKSVDAVFYMCAGLAAACFVFAFGLGWVDIRKKKVVQQEA